VSFVLGCIQVVLERPGDETVVVFYGVICNFLGSLEKIINTTVKRAVL
jgi:hypothetical protein